MRNGVAAGLTLLLMIMILLLILSVGAAERKDQE
jgi:hypothetical protein